MKIRSSYILYFWIISIALAVAKLIFTLRPEIDLFTEEAQYWLWSQNMAWHYYSKPPMVALLNYLSTGLLGNTEIGVRINAIVFGLGISWVTFLLGRRMYSEKVGFWSAMILQSMPMWWLASTFHMTDTALTFFWILTVYAIYRGLEDGKTSWWVLAGFTTALGLMSKLIMILAFPFLIFYLIYLGSWKKQHKHFLIFLLLSLIGFTPMLIWNWQNDFYTFKHLAALGGAGGGESTPFDFGKSVRQLLEYLGGQFAMISIFLLPLFGGFVLKSKFYQDRKSVFLLLAPVLSWIGFAFLSFFTSIEVNWPVFAYSSLAIALAAWLVEKQGKWLIYRNWAIGLSIGIPLLFILPDLTFLKSIPPLKKAEKSVFRRNSGYHPLADRVQFLQDSLGANDSFVFSETYHMASELAFYLPENPQTFMVNMGSRTNQFDLWPGLEQFEGKEKMGIFVSWNYDSLGDFVEFDQLIYEEKFPIEFRGVPNRVATIQVWQNLEKYQPFIPDSF
jgi:4-amino-4-deoxy-L-arabinose transferase-like glycosyltransferase